jgi:hypothetical protein
VPIEILGRDQADSMFVRFVCSVCASTSYGIAALSEFTLLAVPEIHVVR